MLLLQFELLETARALDFAFYTFVIEIITVYAFHATTEPLTPQTHRHTHTQTQRHTHAQTHRHTHAQTHRHTDTHMHRYTDT